MYAYDDLGRVTGIDAGSSVVKFAYSYVDDENNAYRKTFDHATANRTINIGQDSRDSQDDLSRGQRK